MSRWLIRTPPSTGSSSAFFLVVFLVVATVAGLVWRVELRVARVDVFAGSASSSWPRFLLGDTQYGVHRVLGAYLGCHICGGGMWTSELMRSGYRRDGRQNE